MILKEKSGSKIQKNDSEASIRDWTNQGRQSFKRDSKHDSLNDNDYLHLVQNTEECQAADGDHDDPELTGVDDDEAFDENYSEQDLYEID